MAKSNQYRRGHRNFYHRNFFRSTLTANSLEICLDDIAGFNSIYTYTYMFLNVLKFYPEQFCFYCL